MTQGLSCPARAAAAPAASGGRGRLAVEFAALYLGLPLLLAFALSPSLMWTVLVGSFLAGLVLLALTPGFRWAELLRGPALGGGLAGPLATAGFLAVTAVAAFGLVAWLRPGAMLSLPRHNPQLWLTIMLLYPLLSALPQEIIFRTLFFRRYGALFPDRRVAVAVNAGVFALAHLFLWNWVALAMTFSGGAVFAAAWLTRRGGNLPWALVLHALAGMILFTSGLGRFFYHGAVGP
ncbi:MAG: CPBP family intramembrane glutamic endopeptidase [Pseudomonadota bacterium]|nr:CPBP family intramembrane glutamic endopeptidase [Pseudomonadota bacterium]